MKKILTIDTTVSRKSTVKLIGEKTSTEISGDSLLPLIDKLLKKCHTKIEEISEIKINTGPGSYTGLRVGASVANALSYLFRQKQTRFLNLRINSKKKNFFPEY